MEPGIGRSCEQGQTAQEIGVKSCTQQIQKASASSPCGNADRVLCTTEDGSAQIHTSRFPYLLRARLDPVGLEIRDRSCPVRRSRSLQFLAASGVNTIAHTTGRRRYRDDHVQTIAAPVSGCPLSHHVARRLTAGVRSCAIQTRKQLSPSHVNTREHARTVAPRHSSECVVVVSARG